MLLQKLKEYADERLELPPTLYTSTPVRYIIDLDIDGSLRSAVPTDTAVPKDRALARGARRLAPEVVRSAGIKPLLLADTAEYTLGLTRDDGKPARVAAQHDAYMALLARCVAATGEATVAAVDRFLHDEPLTKLRLPDGYDAGGKITFAVWEGARHTFPIDLPAVHAFWAAENDRGAAGARVLQCLVCGTQRPAMESFDLKVKGVPGGQSSGTSLVSINAAAFESYNQGRGYSSPICAECAERFTRGVNDLIAGDRTHIRVADTVTVFWTREETGFDAMVITNPEPEQVRNYIAALRTGGRIPSVDDTAFYAATLSASGGRTVVRDWIDTTVGEMKRSLGAWFLAQQVVGLYGEEPRPLGVTALGAATVRELRDLPVTTVRALVRAALTRAPVPSALLAQAVRRTQAEQAVTRPRAALIKLAITPRDRPEEEQMIALQPNHPDPAYHSGRLLAVLEQAQRLAIQGIKATIVDRFFGAASTRPRSVFPTLVRGAQPHLSKLHRDRPGAGRALDNRLQDVLAAIPDFPAVLTLEQQGLFILGYYHQRAYDRAAAREAAERRRSGIATADDAAIAELAIDTMKLTEEE